MTFSQKIWKSRSEVKWKSNFLENPFGNCRLLPGLGPFAVGNTAAEISLPKTITGNINVNGERHLVRLVCSVLKTLTIIQRSQPVHYTFECIWKLSGS